MMMRNGIAYDRKNRIPAWAAEHLTAANLTKPPPMEGTNGGGDRSNSTFKEDASIPLMFRAKLVDYFRSGYGSFRVFSFFPPCVCGARIR